MTAGRKFKMLFFFLAMIGFAQAYGQWTQVAPPERILSDYNVLSFFQYGHYKFISTTGGLFVTEDLKAPWTFKKSIGFNMFSVSGDSLIYWESGMPLLLDLKTLNLKPGIEPSRPSDYQVFIRDKGRTFLFTQYGGFQEIFPGVPGQYYFKTQFYNQGLPEDKIWGRDGYYMGHPVRAFAKCGKWFFCATWHGLYKAEAPLFIWDPAGGAGSSFIATQLFVAGEDLFGIKDGHLFRSQDYGQTWIDLAFSYSAQVTSIALYDSLLLAGTSSTGIYSRQESESIWKPMNSGLQGRKVNFIKMADSVLVCGTATGGFHYLNPNGTWVRNNSGIDYITNYYSIKSHGNMLFAWTNKKLFSTTDEGNTWREIPLDDLSSKNLGAAVSMEDRLFFQLYGSYYKPFLIYTENGGDTWTDISNNIPVFPEIATDVQFRAFGNKLFLMQGSTRTIIYSDDLGLTWNDVSYSDRFCNGISDITECNNTIYASFCNINQVVRLVNDEWVLCNQGLPTDHDPGSFFICNNQLFFQMGRDWYVYDEGLESWQIVGTGISNESFHDFKKFGNFQYAYNQNKGWVYSDNCFSDIKSLNKKGLPYTGWGYLFSLELVNNTLFSVIDYNGLWKLPVSQISSVPELLVPSDCIEVHPNPSNDYLNISGFPDNQEASAALIDLTGRILWHAKLSDDQMIDVRGINPGVYFVKIRSGNETVARKIIIQRY